MSKTKKTDTPTKASPRPRISAERQAFLDSLRKDYEWTPAQDAQLTEACILLSRSDEAREVIAREGITVPGYRGVPVANPAVAVERMSTSAACVILKNLGLAESDDDEHKPNRYSGLYGGALR